MSDSSRDGFIAVCSTLLGLSTITVGLRFYARKKQSLPLKADDVFAAVALAMYLGATICELRLVHIKTLGYSYHDFTTTEIKSKAKETVKFALAWDVFAAAASASIKLSALFFYRRLFTVPGTRKPFDVASLVTIVIVACWAITFIILPFFQCGTHLAALWNGTKAKYCRIGKPSFLALVISNFILDFWILLMPVPSVLKLHTTLKKKISIIGVFLLAFVGLGASIARMVTYVQILEGGAAYAVDHDLGLAQTKAAYLTMLEAGISLVAVNLPSLWLLLHSIVPENALKSIRSALSLSSSHSNRSGGSVKNAPIVKKIEVMTHPSESATALHSTMPQGYRGDVESYHSEVYAMKELEKR